MTSPLRNGTPDQFAVLRRSLEAAGFTVAGVCERLHIDSVYAFQADRDRWRASDAKRDALDVLIHLFMDGGTVPRSALEMLLPAPCLAAAEALGLTQASPGEAESVFATVLLYPTSSLYIVSDREEDPTAPGGAGPMPKDSVYPAISTNTARFLALLPRTPCDALLDLCAGTGIAALVAARDVRHAWAVDITERSTLFAHFNAKLNGVANFTALQGDLYDCVQGLTFDRIVAHPPYMPAAKQEYIFRDGGTDGEQITRQILAGLDTYLRPGGQFQCSCLVTDRAGAPVEQRVRSMLGANQAEFDVLVVTAASSSPAEYYQNLAQHEKMDRTKAQQYQGMLEALDVERMILCTLVIRRHESDRPAFTLRRPEGEATGPDDIDWVMRWGATATERAFTRALADARPRLSSSARLHMVSRGEKGSWVPESWAVKTEIPFPYGLEAPLDVVAFLARCDGRTTVRQHLQQVKKVGSVPTNTTPDQFIDMLMPLLASGLLEVEALPLPQHRRTPVPKPLDEF